MNKENINSLVNTLGEKLSNNFKIEKEQINKPKLKVKPLLTTLAECFLKEN